MLEGESLPRDIGLTIDEERIITEARIRVGSRPSSSMYEYTAIWNTKEGDELEISALYQNDFKFTGIVKKLERKGYVTKFV